MYGGLEGGHTKMDVCGIDAGPNSETVRPHMAQDLFVLRVQRSERLAELNSVCRWKTKEPKEEQQPTTNNQQPT